jgi:RNA polymerase sigma factor (sigma-70 family)
MVDVSDETLIQRVVKTDDRQAFATLVRRHQSELRGSLRRMCRGDFSRADDLAQEAFINAYRYLPGFRGRSSFRTWLYRIAMNRYINDQKKQQRDLARDEEYAIVLSTAPAADEAECVTARRDVRAALAQLSDAQQLMVDLNLQRGFSHREIVEITGIPLGTVKSHLQRARTQLQKLLLDLKEV